jgi:N-succinyldiaminopimelate aminotransferase
VARVKDVKQWLSFASGTPFQYGITEALASGDGFYREYAAGYQERRDAMVAGLAAIGFDVHEPEGTYFVTAGIAPFGHEDGLRFCLELPERCGVVAVPTQVFYLDQAPRAEVRFAFCKRLDVIEEGLKRLRAGL